MDKTYTVFISSTFNDLENYRKSVHDAILVDGFFPLAMENFTASSHPQWDTIKPLIDKCDYYVLIVGYRYGSIEEASGLSYTEKEYEYAKSIGKPILSFILDESFNTNKDEDLSKINTFRKRILDDEKLAKLCKNKNNLSSDVISALHKEVTISPQNGWIKGSTETYIGWSLEQIDKELDNNEKSIIKLFEIQNTKSLSFNEIMKILKLSKQQFKHYIEHMEELQLLYSNSQYVDNNSNTCELLEDGRKYLIKFFIDK